MIGLEQVCSLSRIARRFLTTSATTTLGGVPHPSPAQSGWHSAIVDDLSGAQEMLDRLESDGHADRHLRILTNTRFEVRWK